MNPSLFVSLSLGFFADANVNGVDDYDRSPLWWAVRKGKFEVAQHLIDAGDTYTHFQLF